MNPAVPVPEVALDESGARSMPERHPGKLLLVARNIDGGIGRHVVDLAEEMAARGWEVHCIRATRSNDQVTDHSARLDRLPGVIVHAIPLARAVGPGDFASYLAFRKIVKAHGPFDIAHGHGAKGGVFVRLPCRHLGARCYSPHAFITLDAEAGRLKKLIYGGVERILGRFFTDALIAVSTEERLEALRFGIRDSRCHLVPNGVAVPAFLPRQDARHHLGLRTDDEVLLFVGRFCRQKAPERFIKLVAELAPTRPKLRGVLIGSGEQEADLFALARTLGIDKRLVFFRSPRAASLMRAAEALIVPSRYEGFAYTMLEALAAGLPIVTYDVGGAKDMIVEGVDGHIVPQGDAVALADFTGRVLENPDVRIEMAKAAEARFGLFRQDQMLSRLADLYDRVLVEQSGRRLDIAAKAY